MINWLKPSMQQHWWITKAVKSVFSPLTISVNYVKDYLDTWNQVYQSEEKENVKK